MSTYRPHPPDVPMVGTCTGCRYRMGDMCTEDGIKVAPGQCSAFERTPTLRELLGRWGRLIKDQSTGR